MKSATSLMLYNKNTIASYIPNIHAVYYLRGIADNDSLYPIYFIGRTEKGSLRDELLEKFIMENKPEVVYINYIEFNNSRDAGLFEKREIERHKPKYNTLQRHQEVKTFIQPDIFNLKTA